MPSWPSLDRSVGPALTLDDFYGGEHAIEVPELQSLANAQNSITQLLRWAFCAVNDFERSSMLPEEDLVSQRDDAEISRRRAQMRQWRIRFEELLESKPELGATLPVATLRMWRGAGSKENVCSNCFKMLTVSQPSLLNPVVTAPNSDGMLITTYSRRSSNALRSLSMRLAARVSGNPLA